MVKPKIKIISLVGLFVIATVASVFTTIPVLASPYCVSDRCKQAQAAEAEASAKATNATVAANTLEGEVERLSNEIAAYEARIQTNEALVEDLTKSIQENTEKLELQQAALAGMLVDMHFEGQPEAIMILAGSNSISDYAEKQSRLDTVKSQVNLSAQAVKSLKEELEAQKKEVERVLADQKLQREAIAEKRAEQQALIAKYRDNAAAYTAEAEEARRIQANEIANEIARFNSGGVVVNGYVDNYPYRRDSPNGYQCPRDNLMFSAYGGSGCQCTSYAGWKAYSIKGVVISGWGHAYNWANAASSLGYDVRYEEPAPHTIAVSTLGTWGHVMWVESVNSNGTINLTEYNNTGSSIYGEEGDFGGRAGVPVTGLYFIYFD